MNGNKGTSSTKDFKPLEEDKTITDDPPEVKKFLIVGIITSEDFQKSKYVVTKLHKSFPNEFELPLIRPMLDVEWNEFITKNQRRYGNGLWSIKNRVAVFKNGEFLGDFGDLNEYVWKKWKFVFNENWHELATKDLIEYLQAKTECCRQLAYLTIAVNKKVVGSLLFELYNDIVPLASQNFINQCEKEEEGYAGSQIHRIVRNSWIQCGYGVKSLTKMPCENYVVPHDRRGVLSTCNNGPHKNNTTQFYIALEKAPWMDYKFVAFGQLIQGDDVLRIIEHIPTYYQAPVQEIAIVKCGEFRTKSAEKGLFTAEEIDQWEELQNQKMDILNYLRSCHEERGEGYQNLHDTIVPLYPTSNASFVTESRVKEGLYGLRSDVTRYGPFSHLPDDQSEEGEDYDVCGPDHPLIRYKFKLYDDDLSPSPSDVTM